MKHTITARVVAGITLLAAAAITPSSAHAGDYAFAVKAPAGLGFAFIAFKDSSKNVRDALFDQEKPLVTKRGADGYYMFKAPKDFKPSDLKRWCADVYTPAKYFENGACSAEVKLPSDGVYRLVLPPLHEFRIGPIVKH